mgnify:CR=1 FL=1
MTNENAVSELIAIVLLLGVLVVGVGIIMVTITSQPLPDEIPNINVLVGNTTTNILIKHNGGDPLQENEFTVVVDGTILRNQDATLTGGDGVWPWTVGETLQYPVAAVPHQISILYTAGGGSVLLKSATLDGEVRTGGQDTPGGPGTTPPTGNITLTFDDQDELDAWVVDQFREQLEGDSIYFTRAERGSQGVFEGTLQFRVTGGGSYLVIGNNPRTNLAVGDEVKFEFAPGKTPDLMFFMLGNKGWSIQAQGDGVNDLRIFIRHNGVWGPDISGNGDLTESWITDYDDYVSMLNFSVKGGTEHTRLIIDNATVLDDENGDTFWFYRIEPAHPTLLVMQYASTGALGNGVYFVGKAERVTRNGNPIYP